MRALAARSKWAAISAQLMEGDNPGREGMVWQGALALPMDVKPLKLRSPARSNATPSRQVSFMKHVNERQMEMSLAPFFSASYCTLRKECGM
jgi:hypothetical protein